MTTSASPRAAAGLFEQTLEGLERALRVEHIATFEGLVTCEPSTRTSDVLEDTELADFDYLPVQKDGRIIGIFEREHGPSGGVVGDHVRAPDESTLMAATEPLTDFIYGLGTTPYRLIVRKRRIDGIATRSDIQKLPVRLLVFTLVTQLEALMTATIDRLWEGTDGWLEELKPNRRAAVLAKVENLSESRMNIRSIEFSEFADKRDVLLSAGLPAQRGLGKAKIKKDFERICKLRDQVAHAATLPDAPGDVVERFVDVFESAYDWITWFDRDGRGWVQGGKDPAANE